MKLSINLNDKVKVKLTGFGMEVLEDWENDILKEFPIYEPHILDDRDEDGYISMSLHGLFDMFGESILSHENCPFEKCEIIIDE